MHQKIVFLSSDLIQEMSTTTTPSPEDLLVLFETINERKPMSWELFLQMIEVSEDD